MIEFEVKNKYSRWTLKWAAGNLAYSGVSITPLYSLYYFFYNKL